jgi:hypothetical protein
LFLYPVTGSSAASFLVRMGAENEKHCILPEGEPT